MIIDCIHRFLCNVGHHDFKDAARWCSDDHSIVVMEEVCKYCGEDAYSLAAFLPKACTSLTRYPLTNSTCEDSSCDGKICDETTSKNETQGKQRKPRRNSKAEAAPVAQQAS